MKSNRRELTFLLSDSAVDDVLSFAKSTSIGPAETTSVEDVHYDSRDQDDGKQDSRREFRVRRFGCTWQAQLGSRKQKGSDVAIRRTLVPLSDLKRLEDAELDADWCGHWFHKQKQKRQLGQTLRIAFERTRLDGDTMEGPIALSIDRDIQAASAQHENMEWVAGGRSVSLSQHLLRMTYQVSLPQIFKALIYDFALLPTRTTVYRESLRAWTALQPATIPCSPTSGAVACQIG